MGEQKYDKKSLLTRLIAAIVPEALVQLKAQFKAQGAGKVNIENLNININVGDKTYNVKPEFPPGTNYESIAEVLDRMAIQSPPELKSIKIDKYIDAKWITEALDTAVNSSAATISTIAAGNISPEGKVTYKKSHHMLNRKRLKMIGKAETR